MSDPRTVIRSFINGFVAGHQIADDEDIFASGYVNSLFVMQLVLMVEKEFGFAVADDDLDIVNFRTVNAIAELVARKTGALST